MAGLAFTQLYPEDIVAMVRAGHPLDRPLRPEDLGAYDLVIPPPGAVIGDAVRGFLVSLGAGSLPPAYETVSLAFGRRVVLDSDAIWFISRGVVAEELSTDTFRALPFTNLMQVGPVGISRREGDVASPVIDDLVEVIRETSGRMVGDH